MDADRKRLTRGQPFTRWVRVPKRNASSSTVVHLRFSFSSLGFFRDRDRSAPHFHLRIAFPFVLFRSMVGGTTCGLPLLLAGISFCPYPASELIGSTRNT